MRHQYDPDESTREDLRAAAAANRRHRARMTRTTNPRDTDYIDPDDFPDTRHQYTGQQPLDLD